MSDTETATVRKEDVPLGVVEEDGEADKHTPLRGNVRLKELL